MISDNAKAYLKTLTILYVEDNTETQDEIAFFLRKRVNKLLLAPNGIDGIELFKNEPVHIIVSDIQMPYLNGIEMVEKIQEFSPDTPVVFITAFNDSSYLKKAKDIGVAHYIQKPTDLMDLYLALGKVANELQEKGSTNA